MAGHHSLQVQHGWDRDLVVMGWQRGGPGRDSTAHRLQESPTDSSWIFPPSWNLTRVSHFLSHSSLPKHMDRTVKSGEKGGCWQDTVQKRIQGQKTGKSMRKSAKKLMRSPEKDWSLVVSDEDRWENEPRNEIQNAGVLTLLYRHPWNPSSPLPSVGFCRSWHASSSGVCVDEAKPPSLLIDYVDITWFHKIAFLIYWLGLLL